MASRHSILALLAELSSPRRAAATHNCGAGAGRICTVGGEAGPGAEDASFAVAGPPSPAAAVWPLSTVCAACVHRANTTRRGLEREEIKGEEALGAWESRGELGGGDHGVVVTD
jgi:hypothetical protein